MDIAVANYGTLTIAILLGSNNGSFRINALYDMGYDSIPYSLVIADFNHDNYSDIAVANYGTSELTVLLSHENEHFVIQKYSTGSDSHPCSIAVGDFDQDNNLDIVTANAGTGNVVIFLEHGNGSFTNFISYSIGIDSHPQFVAVGDFNHDNKPDFVIIDSENDNIIVWNGYGNGRFSIFTTESTGINSDPSSIAVGDFDNDHILDVIITNNNTNNIRILTTFRVYPNASQTTYSTGIYSDPSCVAVGDFNNDHQLDVVFVNAAGVSIGVFIGIGDGTFQNQETFYYVWNAYTLYVAVGDFNNDNNLDAATAMFNLSAIGIYYGYGDGTLVFGEFYFLETYAQPNFLDVGDFNNDTILDIVTVSSFTGNIIVILRYNNGTYPNIITYPPSGISNALSIAVDDLNNDQILDFAVANSPVGHISIYIGYGNGSFYGPIVISTGDNTLYPSLIALGDLNHDNRTDIAFVNNDPAILGVLFGSDNITFGDLSLYFIGYGTGAFRIALVDFNNDTHPDIAVLNNQVGNFVVFLGYGNKTFAPQMTFSTGYDSFPNGLAFGDFNGDKQQDAVVCNRYAKNIGVFLVHYDANFLNETNYQSVSGSHPYSVATGDFNKDNRSDMIVTNSGNDNIEILLDYNNKTFVNRNIYSTGAQSHPQNVLITDLNNDNELDIAITNYWTDNIDVFLGFGNGSFDTAKTYSTGLSSSPDSIIAADLNKDNWTDIVVANQGADNVGVFLGFNYPSFLRKTMYLTGNFPTPGSIAAADFNNDGNCDIAAVDQHAYTIGIFLGDGNGNFLELISYSTGASSVLGSIVIGDFNNDRQLDMIYSDFGLFSIGLLLGYGILFMLTLQCD